MLKHSFCHIPGIGIRMEQRLWRRGITTWDQLQGESRKIFPKRAEKVLHFLELSKENLQRCNSSFFYEMLPVSEHWRLFHEFRHETVYLDIETTSLKPPEDHITTISVYDGKTVKCYVYGENLDDFKKDAAKYGMLVTFSGKSFDVPYIEKYFGMKLQIPHIDLRYVLADLGYKGGLKKCEKALGISRNELDGVDGYYAVLLWNDYARTGRRRSLETLLAYNIEDVVNLEKLMVASYNIKLTDTPFSNQLEKDGKSPQLPYSADKKTIERIRRYIYGRRK